MSNEVTPDHSTYPDTIRLQKYAGMCAIHSQHLISKHVCVFSLVFIPNICLSLLKNIGGTVAGSRSIRVGTYVGIRVGNSSANMSV